MLEFLNNLIYTAVQTIIDITLIYECTTWLMSYSRITICDDRQNAKTKRWNLKKMQININIFIRQRIIVYLVKGNFNDKKHIFVQYCRVI